MAKKSIPAASKSIEKREGNPKFSVNIHVDQFNRAQLALEKATALNNIIELAALAHEEGETFDDASLRIVSYVMSDFLDEIRSSLDLTAQ